LKKITLKEVLKDILNKDHPELPVVIDESSSLFKAIQEGTRGNVDFPGNLF